MICRECGANIPDDANECKFCGAVYGEAAAAQQPMQESEETANEEELLITEEEDNIDAILDENELKRKAQAEKISSEKQAQLAEIEQRRKLKKRRQRRNRAMVVLLVLLCGAAVAAGVYYVNSTYGNDKDDNVVLITNKPTTKPEVTATPEATLTPEPTIEVVETEKPADVVVSEENVPPANDAPIATKKPVSTQKPTVASTQKPVATKKPTTVTKASGITGALVVGGDVVKANGKTYMSFNNNGKWYYATVSDNTTTSFINGKPMTITAEPTSETYNGVAVYKTIDITNYNGNYILQNSGTAIVTDADLQGMSKEQLRLARNEIYARHGRQFNDTTLQNYFNSCSWYKAKANYNYSNENKYLNSTEKQNVKTIKAYEDSIN